MAPCMTRKNGSRVVLSAALALTVAKLATDMSQYYTTTIHQDGHEMDTFPTREEEDLVHINSMLLVQEKMGSTSTSSAGRSLLPVAHAFNVSSLLQVSTNVFSSLTSWMRSMMQTAAAEAGGLADAGHELVGPALAAPGQAVRDFMASSILNGAGTNPVANTITAGLQQVGNLPANLTAKVEEIQAALDSALEMGTKVGVMVGVGVAIELLASVVAFAAVMYQLYAAKQQQDMLRDIQDKVNTALGYLKIMMDNDLHSQVRNFNSSFDAMSSVSEKLQALDDDWYSSIATYYSDDHLKNSTDPIAQRTQTWLKKLNRPDEGYGPDGTFDAGRAFQQVPIGDRLLRMIAHFDQDSGQTGDNYQSLSKNVVALVEGDNNKGVPTLSGLLAQYEDIFERLYTRINPGDPASSGSTKPKDVRLVILPFMQAIYRKMLVALRLRYSAAQMYASMGKKATTQVSICSGCKFSVDADRFPEDAKDISMSQLRGELLKKDDSERLRTEHTVVTAFYKRIFRRAHYVYSSTYDLLTLPGRTTGLLSVTLCNKTEHAIEDREGLTGSTFYVQAWHKDAGTLSTPVDVEDNGEWRQPGKCSTITPTEFGVDRIKLLSSYQQCGGPNMECSRKYNTVFDQDGFYNNNERRSLTYNITNVEVEKSCKFIIWNCSYRVKEITGGKLEVDGGMGRIGMASTGMMDRTQILTLSNPLSNKRLSVSDKFEHSSVKEELNPLDPTKIQDSKTPEALSYQFQLVPHPFQEVTQEQTKTERIVAIAQIQSVLSGYSMAPKSSDGAVDSSTGAVLEFVDLGTAQVGLESLDSTDSTVPHVEQRGYWIVRAEKSTTEETTTDVDKGQKAEVTKVWYSFQDAVTKKVLTRVVGTSGIAQMQLEDDTTDPKTHNKEDTQLFLAESIASIVPNP